MLDKEFVQLEKQVLQNRSSPEQTLYLSVLLQALLDATKPAYKGEPDNSILERDRATAWFFASIGVTAEDFDIICDYAGVNSKYMKEFAFKVLKSGEIEYVRKRINAVLSH
tara:strand:- start:272 stop:604 length:333 start_codon:yes stop_codon:yes gene_type:complete